MLEIMLMKLQNNKTYCKLSELTCLKNSSAFLGELRGIFERHFLYLVVILAQQKLKFLDECYFFHISAILSDAFRNRYEFYISRHLEKNSLSLTQSGGMINKMARIHVGRNTRK